MTTETISTTPTDTSATPPPATPRASRTWSRPLAGGVNKAYDEALALIKRDSQSKLQEITRIRGELDAPGVDEFAKARLEQRLRKLEIESEVNLPEVQWGVKNGIGE